MATLEEARQHLTDALAAAAEAAAGAAGRADTQAHQWTKIHLSNAQRAAVTLQILDGGGSSPIAEDD